MTLPVLFSIGVLRDFRGVLVGVLGVAGVASNCTAFSSFLEEILDMASTKRKPIRPACDGHI
jgi:hypothetical protein